MSQMAFLELQEETNSPAGRPNSKRHEEKQKRQAVLNEFLEQFDFSDVSEPRINCSSCLSWLVGEVVYPVHEASLLASNCSPVAAAMLIPFSAPFLKAPDPHSIPSNFPLRQPESATLACCDCFSGQTRILSSAPPKVEALLTLPELQTDSVPMQKSWRCWWGASR